MADDNQFIKKIKAYNILLNERVKEFSSLSLEEKLNKLKAESLYRDELKAQIKNTDLTITVIENFPDIIDHHLRQDYAVLDFFNYLKKCEKSSYASLYETFAKIQGDKAVGTATIFLSMCLKKLERAKLIEINYKVDDPTITITEKGKNFEYKLKD